MNAQETIDGLKVVKDWDPRPFIIDICDSAIALIQPLVTTQQPAPDAPSASATDGSPASQTLDAMTVAQLTDYAAAQGIDLGGATKKADILDAIRRGPEQAN